jgi:hypothetical protein
VPGPPREIAELLTSKHKGQTLARIEKFVTPCRVRLVTSDTDRSPVLEGMAEASGVGNGAYFALGVFTDQCC